MLIWCKKSKQKSMTLKQNLDFVQENKAKLKHAEATCSFRARKQTKINYAAAKC